MTGFIDLTTIIFLFLAVVVFLRLRSVLGRRTGSERPPFDPYSQRDIPQTKANDDNVISLPGHAQEVDPVPSDTDTAAERVKSGAPADSPLNAALVAIAKIDLSFDVEEFLAGAKSAYEMIVTAYAEGERQTLKQLLSREVYDGFVSAIGDRESRGEVMEFKFVGIDKAEITDAALKAGAEQITVRFQSKLISATYNEGGDVIDGDPVHVGDVTDIWTFVRDISSRDPNWKLVATESVE
jgi:predicted lipid-binding transport protein (Tim44 family)